jgi:hypothetical protein
MAFGSGGSEWNPLDDYLANQTAPKPTPVREVPDPTATPTVQDGDES